jgi:glycosyltransferase involved in cell wall biosynthesis
LHDERFLRTTERPLSFDKTVLQIVPALDAGGAERTTLEIAEAIVEAGGRALVATAGGRLAPRIEEIGGRIFRLPVDSKNPATILANVARLRALIRKQNVDLLHVRSRAPAWSALLAARATGVPLVSTYHGAYEAQGAFKRWYNSAMVRADRVVANSAFTAGAIRAQYSISPERLRVVPRGANLKEFSPSALTPERLESVGRAWNLRPGAFVALLPGRITVWKGHGVAVAAAHLLAQRGTGNARGLQLVFAGDAQGRMGLLEALRRDMGLRGVSHMIDIVGHCADMPAAYALADVVLVPSTRPEAFGRVAVEAGAMERVVIASGHGGATETIEDGATGFLVPPSDAAALADAVAHVAQMPEEERRAMGARARARVERLFSVQAMQRRTLDVYRELV